MSPLSIPAFLYGTAWKEDRTATLTERALRAGFRGIDTANQRKHYFEAAVGEAVVAAINEGLVTRQEVFLQTKFHIPTRAGSPIALRPTGIVGSAGLTVTRKFVEHLRTEYVNSYVLHGPSSPYHWTEADSEVWEAMRKGRDAGQIRQLGVSNVSLGHLERMKTIGLELPAFVQNRCFAHLGWGSRYPIVLPRKSDHISGVLAAHRESGSGESSSCNRRREAARRDRAANDIRVLTRSWDCAVDRHLQR